MTVGSFDLHKGILSTWNTEGIDGEHTAYWTASQIARYQPIQEAGGVVAGTPYPRTVYQEGNSVIVTRSSSKGSEAGRIIREVPWTFRVYAQNTAALTGKRIASDIAAVIMGVYGGHPTITPSAVCLDNGGVIRFQYQFDKSTALDEDIHMATIVYTVATDTPVS